MFDCHFACFSGDRQRIIGFLVCLAIGTGLPAGFLGPRGLGGGTILVRRWRRGFFVELTGGVPVLAAGFLGSRGLGGGTIFVWCWQFPFGTAFACLACCTGRLECTAAPCSSGTAAGW
jgi:hypothetical protein